MDNKCEFCKRPFKDDEFKAYAKELQMYRNEKADESGIVVTCDECEERQEIEFETEDKCESCGSPLTLKERKRCYENPNRERDNCNECELENVSFDLEMEKNKTFVDRNLLGKGSGCAVIVFVPLIGSAVTLLLL